MRRLDVGPLNTRDQVHLGQSDRHSFRPEQGDVDRAVLADELGGDVAPVDPSVDDADRDAGELGVALPGDVGDRDLQGRHRGGDLTQTFVFHTLPLQQSLCVTMWALRPRESNYYTH
jgi:hypothetical protein